MTDDGYVRQICFDAAPLTFYRGEAERLRRSDSFAVTFGGLVATPADIRDVLIKDLSVAMTGWEYCADPEDADVVVTYETGASTWYDQDGNRVPVPPYWARADVSIRHGLGEASWSECTSSWSRKSLVKRFVAALKAARDGAA